MSGFVAALPMYDWPETRAETDAQWIAIRDRLRAAGVDAPEDLTRRNLPDGGLDLAALWRHPNLLFSQTCWGPLELGLAAHVRVICQPDYSDHEGGEGELYSSAIVMRGDGHEPAPADGRAVLPLSLLRGARFAFNNHDSMSGLLGISRDLEAEGESLDVFARRAETGSHRASALAVAQGRADAAAIDCRTWNLFRCFEQEAAKKLQVVGWTARRKGLPYIAGPAAPHDLLAAILAETGGDGRPV